MQMTQQRRWFWCLNKGFSLLESLLALSLSCFLFGLLFVISDSHQKQTAYALAYAEVSRTGMLVARVLQARWQQVKQSGCQRVTRYEPVGFLSVSNSKEILGSEEVHIAYVNTEPLSIFSHLGKETQLSADSELADVKKVWVTDCHQGVLMTVHKKRLKSNKLLLDDTVPDTLGFPRYYYVWHEETYFIKKTGRYNQQGDPIKALYGPEGELFPSVERLKVYAYGHTSPENPIKIEKIRDWHVVEAVYFEVLVASILRVNHHSASYQWNQQREQNNDGHLKQTFYGFVILR